MRFSTVAAALTTASLASARIVGIAAPATLTPNSTFTLTLLTENYVQSVADVAVAWGFSLAPGYPYSLGSFTGSSYLGPSKSNTMKNVTVEATVPEELAGEDWVGKDVVLSAGVYSLYGASSGTTLTGFNVTVKIGEGAGLVESQGQAWIQNGN
ncbi:hypothetical protein EJ02DRAFT_421843 [Clathrospora elynae]|uniref:Secreted protein NIS1 n=1 Tax=Clathrospora elynae TaxID=706981 RepID=A0A6A5SQK1_9PLEO|nr:hypothetical protein EJ02DRAFT_421843 [Clathrospora elynae]